MKTYGEAEVQFHTFLTSALDGSHVLVTSSLGKEPPVPTGEKA